MSTTNSNTNSNSIEVKNLTKKFGDFTSVDSVSFEVRKGEIFGFLGANGAGKSTTIKMLCGILEPTSGDATVGGFSIMTQSESVKRNIGYMSQKFSLYNDLTIEENINFFGGVYGLEGEDLLKRKKWVLKIANLEGKEKLLTGSLPTGIKQRLALGTAVIHSPTIVFLDEPTGGVDPIERRNFWNLINDLSAEGTTVFVTTHYLDEAEFCNRILLIDAGKIIAGGSPKELKEKYITTIILEIECDRTIDALTLLEDSDFFDSTTIFGNYIHVKLKEKTSEDEAKEFIHKLLSDNNIKEKRTDKISPTLEDVFITLLEKKS
jgi:ABC-2 type transport system ATP-binding protein